MSANENLEAHTVFVDESGNAGANLLDRQRIFTLAGVAARDENLPELEGQIATAVRENSPTGSGELKGADAIREDLFPLIDRVTAPVLSAGQPIFWSVVERRFMIAALIVDNLYDHVYNDAVGPEWTFPSEARQNLANHFYNYLSEPTLQLAGKCLVGGGADDIRCFITAAQRELRDHRIIDGFDAVAALSGTDPHIQELSDVLAATYSRNRSDPLRSHRGTAKSPNLTSFFELLSRVEDYYRGNPAARVKILFDSSGQFNEAFEHIHKLLRDAKESEIRFPGRAPIIFGFRSVTSFAAGDSEAHPVLQAADFFAAGIRSTFELFGCPNPPQEISKSLGFFLAFIAMNLTTPLFNYVVSDSLLSNIWPTIERYAPEQE